MKKGFIQIDSETLPDNKIPKGLNVDAARQWYLYDEIRPYGKNTSETLTSVTLCCKPTCAKPSQIIKCERNKRKCLNKFAESETWICYSVEDTGQLVNVDYHNSC